MLNPNLRELCAELLLALDEASEALDRTSDCCYANYPEVYAQSSDLIRKHDKLLEIARSALDTPISDEPRELDNAEVLQDATDIKADKDTLWVCTEEEERYAARTADIDARNKVAQQNYKKTIEDFKKSRPPTKHCTKTP